MNEHVHPIFQGILNMFMPHNGALPPSKQYDPEELRDIVEHHRQEYASGLDSVGDDDTTDEE